MSEVRIVISGDAAGARKAAADAGAALKGLGQAGQVSAGQTAQAFRQLPAQLTDVATQLAGGQSPLLVLLQQGGQVKDSFGGIGPAVRALATYFTPLAVVAGAAAAALGAVGLAAYQGRSEAAEFAKSLVLTGNYAGTSAGQFAAMAANISASSGVTIGSARELLAATVATGAFGAQSIGTVTAAMARLQSISGATTVDVVADFASISRNVTAWAVEHNRQYAFLTKAEYDQIKALQEHGQVEQAMALTTKLLDEALKARQPELGNLQKLWRNLGDEASRAWERMKGLGKTDDLQTQLNAVNALIEANARRTDRADSIGPNGRRKGADARAAELEAQASDLRQQMSMEHQIAVRTATEAAAERQKIEDAASGKADALANADINLRLARARNASALTLSGLAAEQQAVDAAHEIGLLSDQAYADARISIIRREITQQAAEKQREIEIENKRPTNGPASETEKAAKATALAGQLVAIETDGAKLIAAAYIEADKAKLQSAREHAQRWADAWGRADEQVRALVGNTAELRIGLMRDPQAQDQARTDKLIADKRRALERSLPELINSGNGPKALELAKATDDEIAALNDGLLERLKPAWQKQLDGWRDNNKLMQDGFNTTMDGVLKSAEDMWVQFVTTGKLSVTSLVNMIISEMARTQFRSFMGGSGGSIFSMIGKLFGMGGGGGGGSIIDAGVTSMGTVAHEGALIGAGEGRQRSLPARTWLGAARYHTGGLAGNEVPAILQRGEGVFTKGQMRALGAGLQAGQGVSINNAPVIHIDARSDQAQVAQLVGSALAQNNRDLWAQMRARGVA